MTEQVRLEGLGLFEEFPTPPTPGDETTPTVPIPLESTLSVPHPLAGGVTGPVPLEALPTVPIPDLFF